MTRSGIGYDAHRLVAGRRLILGGVEIPFERGLEGHSDADVVVHAIADAILGAAGLGELGELFPAGDERYRGVSSLEFLVAIRQRLDAAGLQVVHVDAVVVAEAPRLGPHREAMRDNVARSLGVPVACVSIKPKSNEGLGFEGRGEGISATAVASVSSRP